MSKFIKFSMFVAIIAIATVVGCKKDPTPNEPGGNSGGTMQAIALEGKVMNTNGEPINGVRVTSGSATSTTDGDGFFSFSQAQVVDKRAVIKFEKSGYFTLTRSGVKANEMYIEAVLVPKGNSDITLQTEFDAPKGTTLKIGGMKVDLPASAIKTANGADYNGKVKTDMIYLDPNNERFSDMMPGGDLAGIRTNGNEEMLISYGMTNVSLTDDKGNPLQLKGNVPAEVTFPIPAGMENNAPQSMPLWHFDEQKGIWIEDGVATLIGDVYVGTVKHFSWVNCDHPEEVVTVKGIVVDCRDEPVANIKVFSGQSHIFTNSKGEYSGAVPANTPFTVSTELFGVSDSRSFPGQPGGSTVNVVPPLKVACGVTIKGKVVCENDGMPVSGAKVTAGQSSVYTNSKGEYSLRVPPGKATTVTVTVNGTTASESVPALKEGDVYNASDLKVYCEGGGDDEPGTHTKVKEGAIKVRMTESGQEMFVIYSWKDNGMKFRMDVLTEGDDKESMYVHIINHTNKTFWMGVNYGGSGQWIDQPYEQTWGGTEGMTISIDEAEMAQYRIYPDINIAGKTCKVFKYPHDDGKEYVYASWNGLIMQVEVDGELLWTALAATLTVPDVAFTKTFNITWL